MRLTLCSFLIEFILVIKRFSPDGRADRPYRDSLDDDSSIDEFLPLGDSDKLFWEPMYTLPISD